MIINSKTQLYGSFSNNAGDLGCLLFNTSFQYYDLNAIYKSFTVYDIETAVNAAKCLNFSGFAVSMPFKTKIIPFLDDCDENVKKTNSCNTVVVCDNKLYGYNTDYFAINDFLDYYYPNEKEIVILGNGSYAGVLMVCCKEKGIQYKVISRSNWEEIQSLKHSIVFNCTPVENIPCDATNVIIHSKNTTDSGKKLATRQAAYQFKIYTGLDFPLRDIF